MGDAELVADFLRHVAANGSGAITPYGQEKIEKLAAYLQAHAKEIDRGKGWHCAATEARGEYEAQEDRRKKAKAEAIEMERRIRALRKQARALAEGIDTLDARKILGALRAVRKVR